MASQGWLFSVSSCLGGKGKTSSLDDWLPFNSWHCLPSPVQCCWGLGVLDVDRLLKVTAHTSISSLHSIILEQYHVPTSGTVDLHGTKVPPLQVLPSSPTITLFSLKLKYQCKWLFEKPWKLDFHKRHWAQGQWEIYNGKLCLIHGCYCYV